MTYNSIEIYFNDRPTETNAPFNKVAADAWSRDAKLTITPSRRNDGDLNLVLNNVLQNDDIYQTNSSNRNRPMQEMRYGQTKISDSLQTLDRALNSIGTGGATDGARRDIVRAISGISSGLDDLRHGLRDDLKQHFEHFRDPMNQVRIGKREIRDALELIRDGHRDLGMQLLRDGIKDVRQGLGPIGENLRRLEDRLPLPNPLRHLANGDMPDLKAPIEEVKKDGFSPMSILKGIGKVAKFFLF